MSIRNGTRRCWATDTIALVLPESKEPSSIWAPWLTTRSASTRPFSGLVWVSPTISSSLIPCFPLIPPAALIASTAICAPRRQACPGSARAPVTGWIAPILNVLDCARGVVNHQARGVHLHGHVREHELDALERGDRLAELLPLLRVPGGRVERRLADADGHRARHRPRHVERAHRDLESLALLTEPLLDRHGAVREVERHGGRAADAHLLLFLADREPRHALLDEEGRDALGALARIDRREDRDHVGVIAVGAPLLRPVQDVVVPLAHRRGPQARGVGAGAGLREGIGGHELAGGELRPIFLPRLRGTGQKDRDAAEPMRAEVRRRPGARPAELLGHQRQRETAHVGAAVLLGHPDAEETGVDERPHRLGRIALRLVVLRGVRRDSIPGDLAGEVTDHPMLFGEIEQVVHGASPSDDLSPVELGKLPGPEADSFAVDLLIVLTESGRKPERRRLTQRRGRQRDPEPRSRVA